MSMVIRIALAVAMVGCSSSHESSADDAVAAKERVAASATHALAYEAFPQWAASHASSRCPASIDDLVELTKSGDATDPWGHPYRLICGADSPTRGIAVVSDGPDGKPGTKDDIAASANPN